MADPKVEDKDFGKKCAFGGTPLKRARRYYRNGLYYRSKNAFESKRAQDQEKAAEAAAKAAPAAPADQAQS